jgi:5-methylcytosine-specific restriction protein A
MGATGSEVRELSGVRINWTYDEIVLACALVYENGWKGLRAHHAPVVELSRILQTAPYHQGKERDADFRSPSSVQRKTFDIATSHREYRGKPTRGNRLDRQVLDDFIRDPDLMVRRAAASRATLAAHDVVYIPDDEIDAQEISADEGRVMVARHLRRERDPRLRRAKIEDAKDRGLAVACEVCDFEFETAYGPLGRDFVEVHYLVPLHVPGPTKTRLEDLALLCSNCHRMIHRASPWLTPAQLMIVMQRRV